MSLRRILITGAFCSAANVFPISGSAQAQDNRLEIASGQAVMLLRQQVRVGQSVAEMRQRIFRIFDASDLDGGGIGPSDQRLREAQAAAVLRVRELSRLLTHDLDGDGAVTTAELRRSLLPRARKPLRSAAGQLPPTPEQITATLDNLVSQMKLSESDADGDGRVTIEEIVAAAAKQPQARLPHRRQIDPAFDLDDDGTITREEVSAALDVAIEKIDADGDGLISKEEVDLFRNYLSDIKRRQRVLQREAAQREKLRKRAEACPIPPVPKNSQIIFLDLHKSPVLSNMTFGDADNWTHVTDIVIEPGVAPIYLLTAAKQLMILRFSGATERLSNVVNIGEMTMGFIGIDRARVAWFERTTQCSISRWGPRVGRAGLKGDLAYIETLTGRPIDRQIGKFRAYQIALPSGEVTVPQQIPGQPERRVGLSGPVWRSVPTGQPDGLIEIDPQDVVAPVALTEYRIPVTGVPRP